MIEMPTYAPQPALPQSGVSLTPVHLPPPAIFKAVSVNADAHRISRALTVPEYLEAWISIPGAAPGSVTRASAQDNGYRLDHYSAQNSAQSSTFTIKGSFRYCHLRKIRLFWRKTSNTSCMDSVVDFRLRGNFGTSVVELRQTAVTSADEYAWHDALWQGSLEKLALLFASA